MRSILVVVDEGRDEVKGREYVRGEDGTCEGEKSGVEGIRIGIVFDVFAIGDKGDLSTNHAVVGIGRGKRRVILNNRI